MTSVGPPQFESDVDEFGVDPPAGEPTSRHWILPVVLGVAALLLVARLATSDPAPPTTAPETTLVPATTTVAPPTTVPTLGYTATDVSVSVQEMTATPNGFFAFAAEPSGDLSFLSSSSGSEWDVGDSQPAIGIPVDSEPRGMWPIPGFGFLAAFGDRSGTWLTFAQSSDGAEWFPLHSVSEPDGGLRVGLVAVSATEALISIERSGRAAPDLFPFVLSLGSGSTTALKLDDGDYVRAAAYDIATGDLLAVVARDTEPGPPGSNHRFRWLSDGWIDADFGSPAAFDVVEMGTWSGRIVALTGTGASVLDRSSGLWATSENYGPVNRVLRDTAIGFGGAAVISSQCSSARAGSP